MHFQIDKQTIKELEIFPEKANSTSIFDFYNRTKTIGGRERLFEIMSRPFSNLELFETRKQEIKFIQAYKKRLILSARQVDFIEHYLRNRRIPLRDNIIDATKDSIANRLKTNSDYYTIIEGIYNIILLLTSIKDYLSSLEDLSDTNPLQKEISDLKEFLSIPIISKTLKNPPKKSIELKAVTVNKLDYLFRVKKKNEFRNVLNLIYEIDVLQSLSMAMEEHNLNFPEFTEKEKPYFDVIDCFHPFLESPVKNSYSFKDGTNLCFITGPNMSGKSTFLKTLGVIIYLSHLGFPVPARKLKISVFKGLLTSINPSDSIDLGFSHYYSEVKRVKTIALEIETYNNMVLILDELFRGTNVKDAFDATLLIVESLVKIKECYFFIASHILEVAESLAKSNNIDFRYFGIEYKNEDIVYDYKLENGITAERTGMHIIKKEEIKEILDRVISKQKE